VPAVVIIQKNDNQPVGVDPNFGGLFRRKEIVSIKEVGAPIAGAGDLTKFLQYTVTDREVFEIQGWIEKWNKDLLFDVVNGPDPQGFRRIKISNQKINQSQTTGEWTQEQADRIVFEWQSTYPTTDLVTVGFTAKDLLQEGTFTSGQAAEFQAAVYRAGEEFETRRRVNYVPENVMQNIETAGGIQSGTAAQLNIQSGYAD
jgi:hypothetical protein